jgi:hypothetical protein
MVRITYGLQTAQRKGGETALLVEVDILRDRCYNTVIAAINRM